MRREHTTVIPDTISWWRGCPWSAGCRRGRLVAVAGQFGTDTDGNVVMPGHHDGQARNALNRMKEICSLLGRDLEDVVDVWSFHQDPRGIEACLEVATREFFSDSLPTWAAAGAPALYRFGMLGQFRALAEIDERRLSARGFRGRRGRPRRVRVDRGAGRASWSRSSASTRTFATPTTCVRSSTRCSADTKSRVDRRRYDGLPARGIPPRDPWVGGSQLGTTSSGGNH